MARHPAIALTGFMGAGKSSAAAAVGERLGLEVLDADVLLEAELGEPIAAYFEHEGEAEFRRREQELVLGLLENGKGPRVIALGGGAIESEPIRAALTEHVTVLCEVDEETAWERSQDGGRPLAVDRDEFAARFATRAPFYKQVARAFLPDAGQRAREAAPWLAALPDTAAVRLAWAASESGSYPAAVGAGALGLLDAARPAAGDELPARLFCIGDRAALAEHRGLLPGQEAEIEIDAAEERKTLAEAERVLHELADAGARRDDALLAFGGGVVGDLAGFCAATYQRGIPIVQAPTTLVAQVDSAYGGKTGVDLPEAKNYIGAYHQPLAVLADPATLSTLPREELAAGFVEVLKTALIAGGDLWDAVRGMPPLEPERAGADPRLAEVIFACARTKIAIVAADERDSGRRAVLNLGHTVGHAIEAATGYRRFRHGEAVGLGLLAALRLSEADQLREEVAGLLDSHGLPTSLDGDVAIDDVLDAAQRDKKRTASGLGFVVLERPGKPRWGVEIDPDRVRAAVQELR